ncbi:endo-1,4-beta-xylanase [Bacillus alkalicellulosilyticus]|uniref:endo-1,4-beta-xylanase n=1 Tax=Alkalihalobacterium alkalicellulosilyticum TaxID=1912214 RepID=UPI0009966446|nr:endo-1,4-beta-xylanase [Bacillus alkalicellulosilyticus]
MSKKFKRYVSVLLAAVLVLQPFMVATAAESTSTETRTVYQENFANGAGVASQSGGASLQVVDKVFEGNTNGKALSVSNRANDYDAADFNFSSVNMENGKTYKIKVVGYVDEGVEVPAGASAVLATAESYAWHNNVSFVAGQAFTLNATYTVGSNASDTKLRIQSNPAGATVPFHIGEVVITTEVAVESDPGEETPSEPNPNPGTETPSEPNQIAFYDFESGVQGWTARGGATLSVTEDGYEGSKGLITTGRTANWHGPSINATSLLQKGAKYEVSGYVKLVSGQQADNVKLSADQSGVAAGVNQWPTISGPLQVTDSEWVQFKGEYTFDLTASGVSIYFEADRNNTEFIVDNVKIVQTAPAPNLDDDRELDQSGVFSDFEDGEQGWVPRGSGYQAVATDADAYRGNQSLLTNAPNQYEGPLLNVLGKMHPGHIYDLSVWVKMAEGQPATSLRISVQSGSSAFTNVSPNVTVNDQEWVQLSGQFTLSSDPSVLNAYVELVNQPSSERLFYIDDFELKHVGKVSEQDRPRFRDNLESISEKYKNHFLIGNAITMNEFQGERLLQLKHHHNLVTAENVMKPEYYYNRATGAFDFADQDEFVNATKAEGLNLHGHVLVWHEQSRAELHSNPDGTPLTREEALANMRTHIETVMKRYGDDVLSWDVVNEAIVETAHPNNEWEKSLRNTGWLRAIGDDYVEQAFRIAKEIVDENGWDMKLYYNDYNDHIPRKAETIYYMVKDINERYAAENPGEVLISGLGMQGHYNEFTNPESIRTSIELFSQLGIEIGVTELDITSGSADAPQTQAEEIRQAQLYAQLFQIYKEHSDKISRITFWGLDDGASWRGERTPLLFKPNLEPKLAYYAVINPEKFLEDYPLGGRVYRQGQAVYGTPDINKETIDSVWNTAPRLTLDRVSGAWNVQNGFGRILWDDENLYVMIQVYGANFDKSSDAAHEHDSVEVFLDRENLKSATFQDGIAQYRVNFDNEASFNPGTDAATRGFESNTRRSGNNYVVEMKIPFNETTPEHLKKIGLDLQINYANNGQRINVATWNDISGQGWNDPSVFGEVTLMDPNQGPVTEEPIGVSPEQLVPTSEDGVYEVIAEADAFVFSKTVLETLGADAKIIVSNGQAKAKVPVSVLLSTDAEYVTFTFGDDLAEDYLFDNATAVSGVYDFTIVDSEGNFISEFEEAITLSFAVNATDIENVQVWYINEDGNPTAFETVITGDNEVSADVNHFSIYGAFEIAADGTDPGTGGPGTGEPGTGEPGTGEPGTGGPGTGGPGTGEPGTGGPGTGEPGTGEPGTGGPGTGGPGTDPDEDGTTSPGKDKDKDKKVKEDKKDKDGKKLPSTATNLYNYLLIGGLLLIAGIVMVARRRATN